MRRVLALTGGLLTAAVLSAAPATAPSAQAAQAAAPPGGCTGYTATGGWWVQCHTPAAAQGGGSSGGAQQCTWWPDVNRFFPGFTRFAPPAPPGFVYLVETCGKTFQLPQLVANGGAVTPAALAQQAYQELRPALPVPRTAPPRGHDGLVGLPEWFWVPAAEWAPATSTVTAGAVWAQVTATPAQLTFTPGAGLAPVSCPGPGAAYSPSLPAASQHSSCTYLYTRSSNGLAGNAYTASVAITWQAAWRGSGGTGGVLPPMTTTQAFPLPVAEAQALYGSGG